METDDPLPYWFAFIEVSGKILQPGILSGLLILIILLFCSALISGSEIAFFSLSPAQKDDLEPGKSRRTDSILHLLNMPERLLSTILVANNLVNIAIVILSAWLSNALFDFSGNPVLGFLIQVIAITFLLLLFGEILPKIYATNNAVRFASFMAHPLRFVEKVFRPVSSLLVYSTRAINKRFRNRGQNISMDDLSDAIDLTSTGSSEEEKILKGIATFGNLEVSEIMKPRMDVDSCDISTPFHQLIREVVETGYSRIPIYEESLDHVKGILYLKDLLPWLREDDSFNWSSLLRPPYFVPENKYIDELLNEFQAEKIHMAIVVDEYGGTSGIVTLEDILEEIVGEITDETDEDERLFSIAKDGSYIFEGKTLLNDFCKVMDIPADDFEKIRGEADTLAGLILEINGEIPKPDEEFQVEELKLKILSADNRRIISVKVIRN